MVNTQLDPVTATASTASTASTTGRLACGFCASGAHARCPGTLINGGTLWRCPCTATPSCSVLRCTTCGNREPGTVADSGVCSDQDACAVAVAASRHATLVMLNMDDTSTDGEASIGPGPGPGSSTSRQPRARAPKVPGKPGAGRPASGKCICCGAPTKGGRFLPGHDAKWLSVQVACFTEGGQDRAEIRDYMRGRGASDALIAKFEKRVGL